MTVTTKLELPDFDPFGLGEAVFNHLSRVMDALLHLKIRGIVSGGPLNIAPLPSPGEVFIVGSVEADGPWEDQLDNLAIGLEGLDPNDSSTHLVNANWLFVTPVEGFVAWKEDIEQRYTYNDSGWFQGASIADLNGEADTVVRDRIILLLDALRGHGVIAT